MLEDEDDDDDDFASIEPPTQVDLSAPEPGADGMVLEEEEFEIEIDTGGLENPAGSEESQSWSEQSGVVAECLEKADSFFESNEPVLGAEREDPGKKRDDQQCDGHEQRYHRTQGERRGGYVPRVDHVDQKDGDCHVVKCRNELPVVLIVLRRRSGRHETLLWIG